MKTKTHILLIVILGITFGLKAQDQTVNGTLTVNENIISNDIIEINADNGSGHVASRLFLKSHDDFRGAGIFSLGQTNNWFMGNPYTDHANSFMIGVAANSVGTNAIAQKQYAKLFINSNGNVGIGTTNPGYNLDVFGTANGIIRAYGTNIGRLSLQNSTRHYSTSVQGSSLLFYDETGGATRMTLDSNGNFGIGTTNPYQKLGVAGHVQIGNQGASKGFNIFSGNDVGLWNYENGRFCFH